MARVFQYRSRNGPLFGIDYVNRLNGKRHQLRVGATTKSEAQALLRAKLSEVVKAQIIGAPSVEALKPVTFSEFVEKQYMPWARATKRTSTCTRDQGLFANVKPAFGTMPLRAISAADVEKYIVQRRNSQVHRRSCKRTKGCICPPPKPATINRERSFVGKVLNMALRRGLIDKNPVPLVKALREDNARDRWLTHDEVALLLKLCPDWLQPIVTVAVNTGMREGELVATKWADIDWKRGTIRVDSGTSKTHKTRHVPVNAETRRALAVLRVEIGRRGLSGPVFVNPSTGEPFLATSVSHSFRDAARAAGFHDVVFHTTRHTFASWCVQAGIPDRQIMEWIGHSSRHMLDRYAHLAPRKNAAALDAITNPSLTAEEVVTNPLIETGVASESA